MRKAALLVAAVMMFGMLTAGCGSEVKANAAEACEAICELYVHMDSTNADRLKVKDSEAQVLFEQMLDAIKTTFMENVSNSTEMDVTEEQAENIAQAMAKARKKIPIEVSLVSEDGDTAQVKISIAALNLTEMDQKAVEAAQAAMEGQEDLLNSDAKAYHTQFVSAYVEDLLNRLAEAEPDETAYEMTVDCEKVHGIWMPKEMDRFAQQLGHMIEN